MAIVDVRSRVYAAASRILGLKGTVGVGEFDVAPVQPVHDLSRLAWQFPGYYTVQLAIASPGAGLTRGSALRSTMFGAFGALRSYQDRETDVWLLGLSVLVTTLAQVPAGFLRVTIGIRLDDDGTTGVPAQQAIPVFYSETALLDEIVAGQGVAASGQIDGGYTLPFGAGNVLPVLLPRGLATGMYGVVQAAAILTATTTTFYLWAGPKGQTPPGMI